MNGVHDLGGMHGFGPVEREEHEPPFHGHWEAVVVAINNASRAQRVFNIDEFRHGIERMDPVHYLDSPYFEHWLDGITRLYIEKGVVDADELARRFAFFKERPEAPALAAVTGSLPPPGARPPGARGAVRTSDATPRFAPGDPVYTRASGPAGHTRLPRYARGKRGSVHACHGIHVFPDTNAHGRGEQPQPLYSVRFEARALWGEDAEPNQRLYLDLWESYLLPAEEAR